MVIRRPSGKASTARIVPVTMLAWVGRSTSIGGARASCHPPQGGRPPHAQADRRRCHAQASGYMFRCAEDREAVRSGYRHASLSHSDFPYSVVRLETDHSAVPICQYVSRRARRWSRRAAGQRTQCALSLTLASTPTLSVRSRAAKISIQRLTGNTVSIPINPVYRPRQSVDRLGHLSASTGTAGRDGRRKAADSCAPAHSTRRPRFAGGRHRAPR